MVPLVPSMGRRCPPWAAAAGDDGEVWQHGALCAPTELLGVEFAAEPLFIILLLEAAKVVLVLLLDQRRCYRSIDCANCLDQLDSGCWLGLGRAAVGEPPRDW
jgi:hypothetical protein